MKSIVFFLFFASAMLACQNTATDTAATVEETAQEKLLTLNAMFVEFRLGDAAHFMFKDKAGKIWDFGGCDDKTVAFAIELPAAQANESNQGWASNEQLQNQWFDLKYVIRQQPQYIDGPIGDVPVIIEAKMVQK